MTVCYVTKIYVILLMSFEWFKLLSSMRLFSFHCKDLLVIANELWMIQVILFRERISTTKLYVILPISCGGSSYSLLRDDFHYKDLRDIANGLWMVQAILFREGISTTKIYVILPMSCGRFKLFSSER